MTTNVEPPVCSRCGATEYDADNPDQHGELSGWILLPDGKHVCMDCQTREEHLDALQNPVEQLGTPHARLLLAEERKRRLRALGFVGFEDVD
jgi:hypothetical protein